MWESNLSHKITERTQHCMQPICSASLHKRLMSTLGVNPPVDSSGRVVQSGLLVNNVSKVVALRVGRCRVGRVVRSLRALLVGTQRPNNRFHPTGVPPLLVGKVQDASG